jgi:hypothetical protein
LISCETKFRKVLRNTTFLVKGMMYPAFVVVSRHIPQVVNEHHIVFEGRRYS